MAVKRFQVIPFVLPGFPTLADSLEVLSFLAEKGVRVETALLDQKARGLAGTVHQTAMRNNVISADVVAAFGRVSQGILRTNGMPQSAEAKKTFSLFLGKGGPKKRTIAMVAAGQKIPDLGRAPLVFLACTKNRGGRLLEGEKIRDALLAVRKKTRAPVYAGYGVTAENLAFFKKAGFDGVFWGTQAVRIQARGAEAFQAYWREKIQRLLN